MAFHMLLRLSFLASFLAALPVQAEPSNQVEIEFEPMNMDIGNSFGGDSLFDMLSDGAPPQQGAISISRNGASMRGPARGGREAELDDILSSMLGGMMGVDIRNGPRMRPRGMPMLSHGMGTPYDDNNGVVMIEGPQGTEIMSMGGGGPPRGMSRNSLPGALLRDLFPGPLSEMASAVKESHPQPFSAPDPMMMNIMQDIDHAFASDIMPKVHKAASMERTPNSCEQDIKANCQGAKSQLHCLGYNHDSISEGCKKDVGRSVPFLCSQAIDKWCDVLETGILTCLYGHMDSLDGQCRDAVLTTKKVINKVNSQKASVVDPATGAKTVSVPEVKTSAAGKGTEQEAKLDAKLGIAPTVQAKPPAVSAVQAKVPEVTAAPTATAKPVESVAATNKVSFLSSPSAAANKLDTQPSSYFTRWKVLTVIFFCVMGIAAYMFASQHNFLWSKAVKTVLVQQKACEGLKLISDNVELPKSTDL